MCGDDNFDREQEKQETTDVVNTAYSYFRSANS
jgi:hypothetical protein